MATKQMLLVLFALIIFSSVMINTMNNIYDLSYSTYDILQARQGQRIIDRYFQEIDSSILSGTLLFENLNTYNSTSDTFNVNGVTYNVNIQTSYCDSLGNSNYPHIDFQKVDFRVWAKASKRDTLWIGTADHPVSKIYAKMGF